METEKFDIMREKLQEFFREQGLTQEDVAARFDVQQPYVNALLTGKKAFGKKTAQRWAEEFGLSASWLLTAEGDMMSSPSVVHQNNQNGDNISGTNNTVNKTSCTDLMQLINKRDEQIDRLLAIIERMQKDV
jgi:transcriptional regulator with XRE-family HTH domain